MSPRKMKSLDAPMELDRDAPARPPRRVFVERREIPGLVSGTARGEAVACRRVLGARRGGRIGFALALAGLALAAPSLRVALVAAFVHVVLGLLAGLRARARSYQTTREVQRLALWTVLTPLGVAALVRLSGFGAPWHCVAAAVAGQVLLLRALRATRAR
jgi:ABC-type dipeptide/oligopeptide/nickel transport system permease subunit